jgi:glycosyltransferase involved in cell wall biosynthesis
LKQNRIHILHLIVGLDIGNSQGGPERFVVELSRHLDQNTFQVTVCALWQRGGQAESHWQRILEDQGIRVLFATEWSGKFNIRAYRKAIGHINLFCKLETVDIIHSHSPLCAVTAMFMKILKKVHVVVRTAYTFVEWGEGVVPWLSRKIFSNWFFPLIIDTEVGVSRAMANQLKNRPGALLLRKCPRMFHLAIDPNTFKANSNMQTPSELSIARGKRIVGTVSRLSREKGHIYLLNAVPLVLSECPDTFFVLIGDGPLLAKLERLAERLGIKRDVIFVGQRADIIPFLRNMDLFVFPSLWEGLPTAILESLACELPIVATNIAGTNELIQDGFSGWLVPPKNSSALARAILNALSQPTLCKEMARRALGSLDSFSIGLVASQYASLYRDLVASPDKSDA